MIWQLSDKPEKFSGPLLPALRKADIAKSELEARSQIESAVKTEEQFVDLAYLLALSRFPLKSEANQVVPHLQKSSERATAKRDVFVFLLNSKEFVASG